MGLLPSNVLALLDSLERTAPSGLHVLCPLVRTEELALQTTPSEDSLLKHALVLLDLSERTARSGRLVLRRRVLWERFVWRTLLSEAFLRTAVLVCTASAGQTALSGIPVSSCLLLVRLMEHVPTTRR